MSVGCNRNCFGSRGFTLFEVVLSLLVVVAMVISAKKFINLATENTKSLEETRTIDRELGLLIASIKADLETIVLMDDGHPIFEICKENHENGFRIFFFTTNYDRNITAAVKYDVTEGEFGKIVITRTALGANETLVLQNALGPRSSFEEAFDRIDSKQKHTHKYKITLSDFRIRVAVKTYGGNIVITYPNAKALYAGGILLCERGNQKSTYSGNLLFFDVTARALTKSDFSRFNAMGARGVEFARDFMFSRARKSFARIVPISESL
ncbi:MAG: hypothetical protein LBB18_04180 [Puniceicoccales bacterium]|jgi:hypothetical protein|nr:hypothetical protein [Puniceicoccales bacterium]